MKRVSQKHIAKSLNLSQTTVSAVLRNDPHIRISEETRQRVLQAAEKGGYWPNRMAGALLSRRNYIIGVAHRATVHQVIVRKLHAVTQAIRNAGYLAAPQDLVADMEGDHVCQFFRDLSVDGVVLIGVHPAFMEGGFKRYLQGVLPVVAIDLEENSLVTQFKSDRAQGFRILTEHLISLGHRRIAALCAPVPLKGYVYHTQGLIDGVSAALEQAGLSPARFFHEPETGNIYESGRRAMSRLLDSGHRPDAVICTNDSWAIGAMSEVARRGIAVPKEMAIVGFQNEMQADYTTPPLTSVDPPIDLLAQRAIEHLIHEMDNPEAVNTKPLTEVHPCKLVVRESCGALLRQPPIIPS